MSLEEDVSNLGYCFQIKIFYTQIEKKMYLGVFKSEYINELEQKGQEMM